MPVLLVSMLVQRCNVSSLLLVGRGPNAATRNAAIRPAPISTMLLPAGVVEVVRNASPDMDNLSERARTSSLRLRFVDAHRQADRLSGPIEVGVVVVHTNFFFSSFATLFRKLSIFFRRISSARAAAPSLVRCQSRPSRWA